MAKKLYALDTSVLLVVPPSTSVILDEKDELSLVSEPLIEALKLSDMSFSVNLVKGIIELSLSYLFQHGDFVLLLIIRLTIFHNQHFLVYHLL